MEEGLYCPTPQKRNNSQWPSRDIFKAAQSLDRRRVDHNEDDATITRLSNLSTMPSHFSYITNFSYSQIAAILNPEIWIRIVDLHFLKKIPALARQHCYNWSFMSEIYSAEFISIQNLTIINALCLKKNNNKTWFDRFIMVLSLCIHSNLFL